MLSINFAPFPVLKTERLLLRCITPLDADAFFHLRSDQRIMKWLDREPLKSPEEATVFINEKILESLYKNEGILWVIALKSDPGKMIGSTGFWRIDKEHYRTEIGYMLDASFWKRGITKEAVQKTVAWLFENTAIHSIEANINPENEPSAALLRSVGFVQEAHFKENYYFNGVFKDSIIYSLVKGY